MPGATRASQVLQGVFCIHQITVTFMCQSCTGAGRATAIFAPLLSHPPWGGGMAYRLHSLSE
jgi:hypothetical protein